MSSPQAPLGSPPPNPFLFRTPTEKAQRVADNVIRQYDEIVRLVEAANGVLNITPDLLRHLQRVAIENVYACAGQFRTWPIYITNTPHQPPAWEQVEGLVNEMCEYANDPSRGTAIHTAAYLMWRLNWIHPFGGGNGRTARAVSYLALCVRLGHVLPGSPTIPEQIMNNKSPYYQALRAADAAYQQGRIDLTELEKILSSMLAAQLVSVYNAAGGVPLSAATT